MPHPAERADTVPVPLVSDSPASIKWQEPSCLAVDALVLSPGVTKWLKTSPIRMHAHQGRGVAQSQWGCASPRPATSLGLMQVGSQHPDHGLMSPPEAVTGLGMAAEGFLLLLC